MFPLSCIVSIVALVVAAGVIVWALKSLPLDPTIQQTGRVAVIVVFVLAMLWIVLGCIPGMPHGWGWPAH